MRLLPLALAFTGLAACGGGPDLVLHVSRLEQGYMDIERMLKEIPDMAGAKTALAKIKARYEEIRPDRQAVLAVNKAKIPEDLEKRIEELRQTMGRIFRAMIGLQPPELSEHVRKELATLDFNV